MPPFAPASVLTLAGLSFPEPDPNDVPPLDPRVFRSPASPDRQSIAVVAWLEDAIDVVEYVVWAKPAGAPWVRFTPASTTHEQVSRGVVVPAGADVTIQITSGPTAGTLRFGFRSPVGGDDVNGPDPSGGGGGDASAANQATQIAQLNDITSELVLGSKETTLAALKASVEAGLTIVTSPLPGTGLINPLVTR